MSQPTSYTQPHALASSSLFGPDAPADIILRSSDLVDFFTIKLLLSFVSPVFRSMFSLNNAAGTKDGEAGTELPIIPLEEDSQTIRHLLSIIYPSVSEPTIHDAGLCMKLGKMSQKYCMDVIETKLQNIMLTSLLIKSQAFRIYIIAVHLKWKVVASTAASNTLNTELKCLPYVEELQKISGSDFYSFLQYRFMIKTPRSISLVTDVHPQSNDDHVNSPTKPFDASSGGDVILRSSDNANFFAFKALICIMSPVLSDMISKSQADGDHGPIIVFLKENGRTVYQLLAIIHNCINVSDMQDYQLFLDVGKAAQKYKIGRVEAILKDRLTHSDMMIQFPFKVYALAFALGWNQIAKTAAMQTFNISFTDMKYGDELNRISGAALFRFMEYRLKCTDAACLVLRRSDIFQAKDELMQSAFRYLAPISHQSVPPTLTAPFVPITPSSASLPSSVSFSSVSPLSLNLSPSPTAQFPVSMQSTTTKFSFLKHTQSPSNGLSPTPSPPTMVSLPKWLKDYITTIDEKLCVWPRSASVMDDDDLKTAINAYEEEIRNRITGGNAEKEPKHNDRRSILEIEGKYTRRTTLTMEKEQKCNRETGGNVEEEPKYSVSKLLECRKVLATAIDEAIAKVPLHMARVS